MNTKLEIHSSNQPQGVVVVSLKGSGDLDGLATLEKELMTLSSNRPAYTVFDFSGLTFIASLSIGAIMNFRRAAMGWGGKVAVAEANELIATALHRVRIDAVLPMFDSVAKAVAAKS